MRTVTLILACHAALIFMLAHRIVPTDCLKDASVWVVLMAAMLPLLVALSFSLLVVSAGRRLVSRSFFKWIGLLAWLPLVLVSVATAVWLGGQMVFVAAAANGYSLDALQQCVPRITSDFLNATGGFLFWSAIGVALVAGGIVLFQDRKLVSRQ